MSDYVDAIIRVKVPKWQIGEETQIFFPDTMSTKSKCEEQPTGKWIKDDCGVYRCSECFHKCMEFVMGNPKDNFCINCGSKMRPVKQKITKVGRCSDCTFYRENDRLHKIGICFNYRTIRETVIASDSCIEYIERDNHADDNS